MDRITKESQLILLFLWASGLLPVVVLMLSFLLALTNLLHSPNRVQFYMDGDLLTKPEPWGFTWSIKGKAMGIIKF